jgi:CTP:molybdopterin cytidylyltransferase MocA
VDVLILAGARCGEDLRDAAGVEFRCEAAIGGRTMLDAAVEAARHVGPVVVVGPRAPAGAVLVPPGATMVESLRKGLADVRSDSLLVVTADLPFLLAEHVGRFLAAVPGDADLAYPVVSVEACSSRFLGMARTGVRLREGRLTGGNLFFAHRAALEGALAWVEAAYKARKSPLRLAAMLGPVALGRLGLSRVFPGLLSLAWAEGLASRKLGCRVRAVVCRDPEVATDVDTSAHFLAAVRLSR